MEQIKKVHSGPKIDWDFHRNAQDNIVNDDGSANVRALFFADPGCMKCPNCKKYYWREGDVVECACGEIFKTSKFVR